MKVSVQLYSLRENLSDGTSLLMLLPKIRAMGFDGVEFAGFYGLPAETLRAALLENALIPTGCHVQLQDLSQERVSETLLYAKALGLESVGVGMAPHSTPEELAHTCETLQYAAQIAAQEGLVVYYHNHTGEFQRLSDGCLPIELLMKACQIQLDTCWSFAAGVDNSVFLQKHHERICSLHLKDLDTESGQGRVLGEGTVPVSSVIRIAQELGYDWLVVEHEGTLPGAALQEIERCLVYVKQELGD